MLIRHARCLNALPVLPLALASAVAGCVLGPSADPKLEQAIKTHYAHNATEEEGACQAPRIDTIQTHQLIDRSETGAEVMTVRYSYFDRHVDMDENWDRLVHLGQPCGGIAEREFSLTRSEFGYQVTAMSGERHGADGSR